MVKGFTIELDYWPRRVDVTSLRAGNLAELLNIAPLKEVSINLPSLRLNGLQGWAALGAAIGDSWLKNIINSQVNLVPCQLVRVPLPPPESFWCLAGVKPFALK